ncbi:hypothetical protein LG3211_0181 [Lysobacter gummosus]|nr:hypothetical protein LG3211_0181 [Lysobacter gummosus]
MNAHEGLLGAADSRCGHRTKTVRVHDNARHRSAMDRSARRSIP